MKCCLVNVSSRYVLHWISLSIVGIFIFIQYFYFLASENKPFYWFTLIEISIFRWHKTRVAFLLCWLCDVGWKLEIAITGIKSVSCISKLTVLSLSTHVNLAGCYICVINLNRIMGQCLLCWTKKMAVISSWWPMGWIWCSILLVLIVWTILLWSSGLTKLSYLSCQVD